MMHSLSRNRTMMNARFIAILVYFAVSSYAQHNETEDTFLTWESLMSTAKSTTSSVIRSSLPKVMRKLSAANISNECERGLMNFGMALMNFKPWAIKMLDASAKIPPGILDGTFTAFGSFDECVNIRVNASATTSKELFRGRYCSIGFQSLLLNSIADERNHTYGLPPQWLSENLKSAGFVTALHLLFGVCLPSLCSEEDVRRISTTLSKPLGLSMTLLDCQVDEPRAWSAESQVSVGILSSLAALCIIGTLTDVYLRRKGKKEGIKKENYGTFLRILKAFSLLANTETMFTEGSSTLSCLQGVKFLSATWIIIGHTYIMPAIPLYLNKNSNMLGALGYFNGHLPMAIIENFTAALTTFFFISGFLMVYTAWKKLEASDGKLNLLMFVIHKYWRITPALIFALLLLMCMKVMDTGPVWNLVVNPPLQNCRDTWWASLFYFSNWLDTEDFCLPHTWYLSALMQIHIVAILLLFTIYRWPKFGILLSVSLVITCMTISSIVSAQYNMSSRISGNTYQGLKTFVIKLYLLPFLHFPSYVVGMIVGYFVIKSQKKLIRKYQVLGWILAVTGALSSLFGLYGPQENPAVKVMFNVCFRIGWSMSIGWMIYACATGIGGFVNRLLSCKVFSPLGQIAYLMYLCHPLVMMYKTASARERLYFRHSQLVLDFLSTLIVTMFIAYVGYMAVEMPFTALEKIIFRKEHFKRTECQKDDTIAAKTEKFVTLAVNDVNCIKNNVTHM